MNYKIITQTMLALLFFFLIGGITKLKNDNEALKYENKRLKETLKEKQDSLIMMYENDLKALEIINNYENKI